MEVEVERLLLHRNVFPLATQPQIARIFPCYIIMRDISNLYSLASLAPIVRLLFSINIVVIYTFHIFIRSSPNGKLSIFSCFFIALTMLRSFYYHIQSR